MSLRYQLSALEQVDRLEKLAAIIEERPEQFHMSWWVSIPDDSKAFGKVNLDWTDALAEHEVDMLAPNCETRACVAGWTACLWGGELPQAPMKIEYAARILLGLDHAEADWLFNADAQHQAAGEAAEALRDLACFVTDTGSSNGYVETYVD